MIQNRDSTSLVRVSLFQAIRSFGQRKEMRVAKGDLGPVSRTNFDKFTYRMGYKVIFTSYESHLLIKLKRLRTEIHSS